jgi:proteic killer suppression protein
MIFSFLDQTTLDIYNGENTKASRKVPVSVGNAAGRKLDMLNAAKDLGDIRIPPGNHLEIMKGTLGGFYSIRVNDQYRIIFRWREGNARDVKIMDYH